MKKADFKKLALLGIAASSIATAGVANAEINSSLDAVILAHGCGAHGCKGASDTTPKAPNNNQVAEEDQVPPADGSCKSTKKAPNGSCAAPSGCTGKSAPASGQYRA